MCFFLIVDISEYTLIYASIILYKLNYKKFNLYNLIN